MQRGKNVNKRSQDIDKMSLNQKVGGDTINYRISIQEVEQAWCG